MVITQFVQSNPIFDLGSPYFFAEMMRRSGRDLKHLLGLGTRQRERRQELAKRGCKIDSDGNGTGYGG